MGLRSFPSHSLFDTIVLHSRSENLRYFVTMSFKWREKHMAPFLETYRRYECLWNTKCRDYRKSNAREKAYFSMLADLNIPGLTVADIKAKIKTIRTRYGAELTKIRNSERGGAGDDDVYEPRLFWFKDADVFLRNVFTPKPSSSNLRDLDWTGKDTSSSKATNASQDFEPLEQQMIDIEDKEPTSPENIGNSPAATTPEIGADLQNCKKVRKRSLSTSDPTIHEAIKKSKQVTDDNKQYPNEFDVFCESLAIQLKKMPLHRAVICQEKLQSVMTQERLFQITQSNLSTSSSSSTYQQLLANPNSDQYSTMSSPDASIHSENSEEAQYILPQALSSAGVINEDRLSS